MSKVLVTGGLGFIGSNLVDKLVENNDVWILDNDSINSKYEGNEKVKFIYLKNVQRMNTFLNIKFDVIYHLAAESRIQPSLESPENTFDSNIMGTVQVCNYARLNGCKVIYASSCTVDDEYLNPYAYTKSKGEEICKLYNEIYNVKTSIARFYNVYGKRHYREGDHATVLGIFEKQYMEGKPLSITGDGKQKRDFVHVDDIVDGLIKMSNTVCDNEVYEFGCGKCYSIDEIANMFSTKVIYIDKPYGEMDYALADIYDAVHSLNWKPKIKIKNYIKEFIDENRTK